MSGAVEGVALLPCPFCGNSMEDRGYGVMHTDGARGARCILSGYSFPFVEAWNTRTTPPARSYADGVADAAAVVDAEYDLRKHHHAANKAAGNKKEARDFETMMIAHTQSAAAIRLLSQGGKT